MGDAFSVPFILFWYDSTLKYHRLCVISHVSILFWKNTKKIKQFFLRTYLIYRVQQQYIFLHTLNV